MLDTAPRAFLRHAVAVYYADVTRVSTENAIFTWQAAFHWTLVKFRSAVLRWAVRTETKKEPARATGSKREQKRARDGEKNKAKESERRGAKESKSEPARATGSKS